MQAAKEYVDHLACQGQIAAFKLDTSLFEELMSQTILWFSKVTMENSQTSSTIRKVHLF